MPKIVKIKDLDVHKHIKFGTLRKNPRGGSNIPVSNPENNGGGLLIQLPWMLNWGPSDFEGNQQYAMSLKIDSENEEHRVALDKLKELQDYIVEYFGEHGARILNNNKMTKDLFEMLFTFPLKYPKDKNSGTVNYDADPHLKVKVPFYKKDRSGNELNKFGMEVYDEQMKTLYPNDSGLTPVELIPKASQTVCCVRVPAIYDVNGKYYLTFTCDQCVVRPREELSGKCHISLDGVAPPSEPKPTEQPAPAPTHESTTAELVDSDADVTDHEDEVAAGSGGESPAAESEGSRSPTPPPAPKKPKRRVVRRSKKSE